MRKTKENSENKTDAVRERMEFYTMQWPCKSSTKMEPKLWLVSMAIVRNTDSTSNAIDFTGKSTWSAWVSIILYLQRSIYVHGQNHAEVDQVLLHLSKDFIYFFCWFRLLCIELSSLESSSLLFFWTVSLSWLSHNFINTSSKPGEHAGRPEDVCLEIEISWRFGWRRYVCPEV